MSGQNKSNTTNFRRLTQDVSMELRSRILEAHKGSDLQRPRTKEGIIGKVQQYEHGTPPAGEREITVTLKLTEKESSAIHEYAKCCDESLPELIRKSLIREATLADGYGPDDPRYQYSMKLPDETGSSSPSSSNHRQKVQDSYNHIRSILGWKKIEL